MRIIGGKFRGKNLEWLSNAETRPTTDRVKENIFNILTSSGTDFESARVLDMFAGSGQIGIECFSRGSKSIIFIDNDEQAQKIIKKNCELIGLKCTLSTLAKLKEHKFDLVFLDPPYMDTEAPIQTVKHLFENNLLSPNATIVIESEREDLAFDGFIVRQKRYGRAVLYILTMK